MLCLKKVLLFATIKICIAKNNDMLGFEKIKNTKFQKVKS